jgi:hypothetical protein
MLALWTQFSPLTVAAVSVDSGDMVRCDTAEEAGVNKSALGLPGI